MRKLLLALMLTLGCLYGWRQCAPIRHAPGVLVSAEPRQTDFTTPQPPIRKDDWTLKPLASYTLEARVLSVAKYSEGPDGHLSPYDLAVGWGSMSDSGVLEKLDIRQGHRIYRWTYWGQPPIPEQEIISHSCNVHLIPADQAVLDKLRSVRAGSLVRLGGLLVEASHPQGDGPWRSSLSRTDTGAGSCEIIYVKFVTVK